MQVERKENVKNTISRGVRESKKIEPTFRFRIKKILI